MNETVKELKKCLDLVNISPEKASKLIGCSTLTVYRWLRGENPPSRTSQRRIKEGIEKIKEAYPKIEPGYGLALKMTSLWRIVRDDLTPEEHLELFNINDSKGVHAYVEKLEELVKKYKDTINGG